MIHFRQSESEQELISHVYPKPNIPNPGQVNRCWVTFLGSAGHCEALKDQFPSYNSDDSLEGYEHFGSGYSKSKCLARKNDWESRCQTPVLMTYLPDSMSSNWKDENIAHDAHGQEMFEENGEAKNKINPESLNPFQIARPQQQDDEDEPKDYEDTPEFRKSLNLEGTQREKLLESLRRRLGIHGGEEIRSPEIKWHRAGNEIIRGPPASHGKKVEKSFNRDLRYFFFTDF